MRQPSHAFVFSIDGDEGGRYRENQRRYNLATKRLLLVRQPSHMFMLPIVDEEVFLVFFFT